MSNLDPEQVLHDAPCLECGARIPVQLSKTRLEQRPWRLGWKCIACGKDTLFPAPDDLIPAMLELERAGGVAVSAREVKALAKASVDEFEAAVREELLP